MSYEKKAIEQYRNEVKAIKKMIEEGEWNYAKTKCGELIKRMDIVLSESEVDKEICYECGKSVAFGSGRFVNRIPLFDEELDEIDRPFPQGKWLCAECEEKLGEL